MRLLRRRPPETLLCGARVSHAAKCFSVGQVHAGQLVERSAPVKPRFILAGFLSAPRGWKRRRRWRGRGGEVGEVGLDRGIARRDLALIGVEEFKILLQHKDVFNAVVAGQRRDNQARHR